MPHYPFKPAKEVIIDMINDANDTAYTAAQLTHGVPVIEAAADDRNTRLPVSFATGALANGAIDNVYYKRIDFDAIFGARAIELTDEGFTHTVDLLPLLFDLYGVVVQADDVVNEALGAARPLIVTVQANANSLMYTGSFDLTVVADVLNWKEPIDEEAVQLFVDPVSPFNGDWFPDTTWKSEGTYSLRSADIGNNQQSETWIDIVEGSGKKVSFDYRISSELNYDFLHLLVNNVSVWSVSGASTGNKSITLPAGAVNVKWRYIKDETDDGNLDTAWIDMVRIYTPAPFLGGIYASHSGGTRMSSNLTEYTAVDDADGPFLANSQWATWDANGPMEIIAIDGLSTSISIHATYDGSLNWIKRTNTALKLSSNDSVFWRGKYYFLGQDRSNSQYGIYRLDRTGTGEAVTFTPVRVLQISGSNCVIAANSTTLAVMDGVQTLRYTTDPAAITWQSQTINHPYPTGGLQPWVERADIDFIGADLIIIGKVNSFDAAAPNFTMAIGQPGGTFTWKGFNPWGAGNKGTPTYIMVKVFDKNKILLTTSEPQNGSGGYFSSGDTFLSTNIGDSWTNVDPNHGIYPRSIADDGVNLMITGFRQRAGQFYWQAQSQDRGASWQHDADASSFFGTNQSDYTFALGVPNPRTVPVMWDPLQKDTGIFISVGDGQLIDAGGLTFGTFGTAWANRSRSSGKYYFEFKVTQMVNGQDNPRLGLARVDLARGTLGEDGNSCAYSVNGTRHQSPAADIAGGTPMTASNTLRVAGNALTGEVWMAVEDGAWLGGGDPVTGTSPTFTGMTGPVAPAASIVRLNAGTNDAVQIVGHPDWWTFSAPAGFEPF